VMGIFGGLRRDELVKLNVDNVDDRGAVVVVKIRDTKTGGQKSFTIIEEEEMNALSFLRKYTSLRPKITKERRYFLGYRNGRCISQVVGKNSFGSVPSKIAKYLGYVDAKAFTGHCLRRTSATLLVDAGGDMLTLKRHGQWKSDTVASGYIEESMASKNKISRLIGTGNGEAGTSRETGTSDENKIFGKTDASNLNVSSFKHSVDLGNCSISGSSFTNCTFNFK
jgi:integrase